MTGHLFFIDIKEIEGSRENILGYLLFYISYEHHSREYAVDININIDIDIDIDIDIGIDIDK